MLQESGERMKCYMNVEQAGNAGGKCGEWEVCYNKFESGRNVAEK